MAIPTIQGNLPFQSLAAAGAAQAPLAGGGAGAAAALPGAYDASYKSALGFNEAQYGNVLAGYQGVLSSQQDALSSIGRGYSDLSQQVLGGLEGAGAAERQRIGDAYAAAQGQAGQSLVSRGLGNSTVVDSTNRGLTFDAQKQYLDLADRLMQQRAGYTSQLGLAGLAQQQQSVMANSGLAQNQLGWMNSVNAPYPDAGMYSQLAQQYGMTGQADKDRNTILGAASAAGRATPQSSGAVSRGGGGFFTQPSDFSSGGTYQPQSYYSPPQYRPQLGAVGSQAAGDAAKAYFDAQGGFEPGAAVGGAGAFGPLGAPQQQQQQPFSLDYTPPEQGAGYYGYGAGPTAYGGLAGGVGSLYGAEANFWEG